MVLRARLRPSCVVSGLFAFERHEGVRPMTPAPWPAAMRAHLAQSRRDGRTFPAAWEAALAAHPPEVALAGIFGRDVDRYVEWTCRIFSCAYARKSLPADVTPVRLEPYGDTAQGGSAAEDASGGRSEPSRPVPVRCKSADGCDRKAGHGRFGSFCERHAAELAALDMSADFTRWDGKNVDESRKRGGAANRARTAA